MSRQNDVTSVPFDVTSTFTGPGVGRVLVVDDSGDRKDGSAAMHVGKQHLDSVGKIGRSVVTVITCWADERGYYPLHAVPYTVPEQ
jgi:SRSO17 transposase